MFAIFCLAIFLSIETIKMYALRGSGRIARNYIMVTALGLFLFLFLAFFSVIESMLFGNIDTYQPLVEEVWKGFFITTLMKRGVSELSVLSFASFELFIGKYLISYNFLPARGAEVIDNNVLFFAIFSATPVVMHLITEKMYHIIPRRVAAFATNVAFHMAFNAGAASVLEGSFPSFGRLTILSFVTVSIYIAMSLSQRGGINAVGTRNV